MLDRLDRVDPMVNLDQQEMLGQLDKVERQDLLEF